MYCKSDMSLSLLQVDNIQKLRMKNDLWAHSEVKKSVPSLYSYGQHHQLTPVALTDDWCGDEKWGGRRPLLVKHEMTTGWQPDGNGSGQHTGVLWIHVLHAHDICTYSALVHRVVKSWLFCHVVIWWRGWRHSDRLPLKSEQRVEKQGKSCKGPFDFQLNKWTS